MMVVIYIASALTARPNGNDSAHGVGIGGDGSAKWWW